MSNELKPVATVHVTNGGYSMSLATYIMYGMSEGNDQPLFTADQLAEAVKAREGEIVAWLRKNPPMLTDHQLHNARYGSVIADVIEKKQVDIKWRRYSAKVKLFLYSFS